MGATGTGVFLGGSETAMATAHSQTSDRSRTQPRGARLIQHIDGVQPRTQITEQELIPKIVLRDQATDGTSIVIEEIQTDQPAQLRLRCETEDEIRELRFLDTGSYTKQECEFSPPLEESQELSVFLSPEDGGSRLVSTSAQISVETDHPPYEGQSPVDFVDDINDLLRSDDEFDNVLEVENFLIFHYDEYADDAPYIGELLSNAKEVWNEVHPRDVDDVYGDWINIKLHREEEWGSVGHLRAEQFYYPGEVIHSRIRFVTPSEHPLTGTHRDIWFRKNMIHEYGHILQTPDAVRGEHQMEHPEWFTEGQVEFVAVFESDEEIREHFLKREHWKAIVEQLETGGAGILDITEDAYQGGSYLVKFMVDEWGHDTVHDLLAVDVPYFGQAIVERLEVLRIGFETRWLRWVNDNFEAEYYAPTYDKLEAELIELQNEIDELKDEKIELKQEVAELEAVNRNLRDEVKELESGKSNLREQLEDFEDDNDEPLRLDEDAALPGPGIVGTVGSLIGAGYVLNWWINEESDEDS